MRWRSRATPDPAWWRRPWRRSTTDPRRGSGDGPATPVQGFGAGRQLPQNVPVAAALPELLAMVGDEAAFGLALPDFPAGRHAPNPTAVAAARTRLRGACDGRSASFTGSAPGLEVPPPDPGRLAPNAAAAASGRSDNSGTASPLPPSKNPSDSSGGAGRRGSHRPPPHRGGQRTAARRHHHLRAGRHHHHTRLPRRATRLQPERDQTSPHPAHARLKPSLPQPRKLSLAAAHGR